MNYRRLKAYQRVNVTTATPGELITLLYDGLIKQARIVSRAVDARMPAAAGKASDRAVAIIGQLADSLRKDAAPELAASLHHTYAAWTRIIVRAQVSADTADLEVAIDQMTALRQAWRSAATGSDAKAGAA